MSLPWVYYARKHPYDNTTMPPAGFIIDTRKATPPTLWFVPLMRFPCTPTQRGSQAPTDDAQGSDAALLIVPTLVQQYAITEIGPGECRTEYEHDGCVDE